MLRCRDCGNEWKLYVSYNLDKDFKNKHLYHYCPYCKRNTLNEILVFIEE
ncbi:MAG: hypothetical protein QXT88_00565 [Desulfurococcaceae archaeon]